MSAILKSLANEISTIKSTMNITQQQSHQQQRPFNPSLQTYTPYTPHRQYGAVVEVEVVDDGVVMLVEVVADKEAENEVDKSNKYSEQILPNTVGHTVLAVIPVGSTKPQKKDISITLLST